MTNQARYTRIAMALHWAIAVLILLNLVLAELVSFSLVNDEIVRPILNFHKSTGFLVLVLMLARVAWRLTHRPPPLPATYQPWEATLSHWAHGALYALALAMPLSGWVHDSAWNTQLAHRFAYKVYGLFTWPQIGFIANLPPDYKEMWHVRLGLLHAWLGYALMALILVHAAGALKHQFIDKEAELQRMLPWGK